MIDSPSPFQPPQPTSDASAPVQPDANPTQETLHKKTSYSDALSSFSDYLSEYPQRLSNIKNYAVVGVLLVGCLSGAVLLKDNLDTRKQASEGNPPQVCKLKDPAKMATKKLENSSLCYLNGGSYYACNDGYSFTNNQCVMNSPAK